MLEKGCSLCGLESAGPDPSSRDSRELQVWTSIPQDFQAKERTNKIPAAMTLDQSNPDGVTQASDRCSVLSVPDSLGKQTFRSAPGKPENWILIQNAILKS